MRKKYIVLCLIHLLICTAIIKFFKNYSFIRGFLGDAVFMGLMYHSVKSIYDFDKRKLMILLLLLAFSIEVFQYFKVLSILNLTEHKILKFLLGATFDVNDLIAYSLGIIIIHWEET